VISFSRALREYQSGQLTEDGLAEHLDRLLADGRARTSSLLDALNRHHNESPLPTTLKQSLADQIATGKPAAPPAPLVEATQVATVQPGGEAGAVTPLPLLPEISENPLPPPLRNEKSLGMLLGVGDTLNDRFRLEEMIGQGGMSQVYRATDLHQLEAGSENPDVAVKLPEVTGIAEETALMLAQREAKKLQALSHPNIVRVNDFNRDRDTGVLFMTMEYLTGEPLSRAMIEYRGKGMPTERAMGYIGQMGAALQHAHTNRFVHADFKPSNVFITEEDQVKVIDFGIARAFQRPGDNPDDRTIFDPRVLGALTPAYASPEMIEGHEPDPRDDVYSLGCVAYELLTGRHPFSRMKATEARQAKVQPVRPTCLNRRQWRALRAALAFDRDHRTRTVAELIEALLPRRGNAMPWARRTLAVLAIGALTLPILWKEPFWPKFWPQFNLALAPHDYEAEPTARLIDEPLPGAPVVVIPDVGTVIVDCPVCPPVTVLPAGSALIGAKADGDGYAFETPRHPVNFERRIAIGTTEVTRAEFRAFVAASDRELGGGCATPESGWLPDPSRSWQDPGYEQDDRHPVTCISWLDAKEYVTWLSDRTGARYRLPSEAEWEYAARIGSISEIPGCERANLADQTALNRYPALRVRACSDGYLHTAPADAIGPDALGLVSMSGNLFEWAEDCWNDGYDGAPADGSARTDGDCAARVLRGGSWFSAPREQRISYRNHHPWDLRSNTFGFRVVRDLEE